MTDTTAHISDAAQDLQVDTPRNTMSVSNLLNAPTLDDPNIHEDVPLPPSTPPNPVKEEADHVDTITSEPSEPEDLIEADEDDDVDFANREFVCVNDEFTTCRTGQYTKDLSRKVISDHFGRNKACTRDITNWPLFCRKHYQRATYNKELWQIRKMKLILRQIDIIETQYPGTTYDVHFKKSEEVRLNQYSRHVAAGMSNAEAAEKVAPNSNKNFEAPIDVLRELDQYLGSGKSGQEVKDIIDVISQMLVGKDTEQIPAIEFLPKIPSKPVTPKKASGKIQATKSPKTPKTPKTPGSSSRISNKGSIKKTK